MSQWRGRFEDNPYVPAALENIDEWYHIPLLAVVLGFMLWTRVRSWSGYVVDGTILYGGNDPWYHLRQVQYTVQHWPNTMPFDPWTYFPFGTHSSQFGTVFDQIVATAALIVGLGDPSAETIRLTLLVAPAVFGTLVALPTYVIGRRLSGRLAGLLGVVVLALSTGGFLSRTVVGFSDHHAAEAFFQVLAVLGVVIALAVARSDKPVYELAANREFDALRRPVGWAAIAGFAVALYIWTWAPGVLLLGILGVYFTLQLSIDYVSGRSPEPNAMVGAVTFGTAGILTLAPMNTVSIQATAYSLLQPGLAFTGAAGCVFLAWLARAFDRKDVTRWAYPGAVVGIIVALAGLTAVLAPDLFRFLQSNVLRVVGFNTSPTAGTVGEAQPLSQPFRRLFVTYGLAYITAFIGVLVVLGRQILADEPRSEELFVVVWALFITAATFTQARFGYYLAAPVAILTAVLVGRIFSAISLDDATETIETYQVLTLIVVLLLVTGPLVVDVSSRGSSTVLGRTESLGPGNGIQGWHGTLDWMADNTPEEGNYGGAGNDIEYYGTFPKADDHDYPAGSYGVISWWDYGHWITAVGERIPNANPFQQGATSAANFLLAPNETTANENLERMSEDDAETRYVIADWKMTEVNGRVGGKFFAPIVFESDYGVERGQLYQPIVRAGQRSYQLSHYVRTQRFYESQIVRLNLFHGSAVRPRPIVVDWELRQGRDQTFRVPPTDGPAVRTFRTMAEAREYVEDDGTSQIGGVGTSPSEPIPALEHYRLVKNSEVSAIRSSRGYQTSLLTEARGLNMSQREMASYLIPEGGTPWTKLFERVPGATIEGTGPANTTITANVRMQSPATDSSFTYRQQAETDADGSFTMTVPYSTTGYENWGPADGHTNVSVRAAGPYRFSSGITQTADGGLTAWRGTANVSEARVIGEDDSPVTVTLEEQTLREAPENLTAQPANATTSATNTTDAGATQPGDASGSENETLPTATPQPTTTASEATTTATATTTPTPTPSG
jgi:dolichyl-diphosphooligosaccharide--protein glycosyltransferase